MIDDDQVKVPPRYCIVGAGASGLIAARALLRRGIEVDIVERNPTIGGIWEITHADSPVYDSCNFISNKTYSGFIGYPMSDDLPDYPRWDQIRDYIRDFADAYDLTRLVECGLEVVSAAPLSPSGRDGWRVEFATGEERLYQGVIWACGQQHAAYMPELLGAGTFTGEVIHSSQYKSLRQLADRRVLVVGGGNSAVDIVSDAAAVGSSAALSLRKGYWFMPKRIFGYPFLGILWGEQELPPELGLKMSEDLDERVDWVLTAYGDYERLGLPLPDEPWNANHQTTNDMLGHYLAHGRMSIRPAIERLDGDDVVYLDGTRESVDLIVMATGYSIGIPWLDPELVDWVEAQPYFHLGSMSQKVHGLYACGLLHFGGDLYKTWDQLFQTAVNDIVAELTEQGLESAAEIRENYRPNLKGDLPLRKVHRNINHYDVASLFQMFDELQDKFGIEIPGHRDPNFYPKPAEAQTLLPEAEGGPDPAVVPVYQ